MQFQGRKIGRNELCPCGSNIKLKKCHGSLNFIQEMDKDFTQSLNEAEAKNILQQQQQGLGNPIVSTMFKGYRIVAVANKVYQSTKWKTFHDFLIDYMKIVLGDAWGNEELKKPLDKRHPILQWYDILCKHQQKTILTPGEVHNIPTIGAVDAYIRLAYNLYLLAHNQPGDEPSNTLQQVLIDRLKHPDEFPGAYYETYVYAMLIKAGFAIELEDQGSGESTHVECTAICKTSGKKYSVEAKSIRREGALGVTHNYTSKELGSSVRTQLIKALRKQAKDIRIIFIDVNLPAEISATKSNVPSWIQNALTATDEVERIKVNGSEPDSAYVFYTNHPAHYHKDESLVSPAILAAGLRISDFGHDKPHKNLIEQYNAEKKHNDIVKLFESIKEHYDIPSTFDPILPSQAFAKEKIEQMKIGRSYLVPDEQGNMVVGELTQALVMENWKAIVGCFQIKNPPRVIMTKAPISDDEIQDYKKHPDIFFGVYKKQGKKIDSLYETFKWLLGIYSKSDKEKLLSLMKNAPDHDVLKSLSQEELAIIYSERMAVSMFNQARK